MSKRKRPADHTYTHRGYLVEVRRLPRVRRCRWYTVVVNDHFTCDFTSSASAHSYIDSLVDFPEDDNDEALALAGF